MTSIFDDIRHAFTRGSNAVHQLILINVIVFVALIFLRILYPLGLGYIYKIIALNLALPAPILDYLFKPWTIFTYFFTHEGFLHIIFNMLNLYWFGQLIREYLGNKKSVSLYILGGIS